MIDFYHYEMQLPRVPTPTGCPTHNRGLFSAINSFLHPHFLYPFSTPKWVLRESLPHKITAEALIENSQSFCNLLESFTPIIFGVLIFVDPFWMMSLMSLFIWLSLRQSLFLLIRRTKDVGIWIQREFFQFGISMMFYKARKFMRLGGSGFGINWFHLGCRFSVGCLDYRKFSLWIT